jgi:hypothetical protein
MDHSKYTDLTVPTFDQQSGGLKLRFEVWADIRDDTQNPKRRFSYSQCLRDFGYADNVGILSAGGQTKCVARGGAEVLVKGGKAIYYPPPNGSKFVFEVERL